MAGLIAGYFPSNYFTHGYWQTGNQYWTAYGTALPPAPPTYKPLTGRLSGRAVLKRRPDKAQLRAIKAFFEAEAE